MERGNSGDVSRFTRLLFLAALFTLATSSIAYAQEPYLRLVREFEMPELGVSNPAGLIYSPAANALLVAPAAGSNDLRVISFAPDLTGSLTLATQLAPLNMVFDNRAKSLLSWDASTEELIEIEADEDGLPKLAAEAVRRFNGADFGIDTAAGMTVDPATGHLYVLVIPDQQAVPRIVRIAPDPQQRFDGPVVSTITLNALRNRELRGIAFNPDNGRLYVLDSASQTLFELSDRGRILSRRDLSSLGLKSIQNMAFAPSGDLTDDPSIRNLYVVDSGEPVQSGQIQKSSQVQQLQVTSSTQTSGDIMEISLTEPEVMNLSVITEQGTLVQTIQTSIWSPSSPDPAGIAYFPPSDNLLVTDSEVNEMAIFTGINHWETTLTGSQIQEASTIPFTDEPTGIAYNPNNQHLFFSDDTGVRKVYEMDPGSDGLYYTADDVITFFNTGDFSNTDPEGIAYDTHQGHLFIAGGANAEVYDVDPGPNGIFDGVPPAGDDIVSQFDTAILGLFDPEGVEFNPDTGTLYIVSQDDDIVVETTREGTPIRVFDIAFLDAKNLSGLAYGPTSTNPSEKSLYIIARGRDNNSDPNENDGMLYEISLGSVNPTFLISDAVTLLEGDTGTVDATFTVSLSNPSTSVLTVDYSTADGSATAAGGDYMSASGQLTFQPTELSKTVTIQINGDPTEETDENFFVNLSNAVGAPIEVGQSSVTITDDDGPGPVVVSFQDGVNGYAGTRDASLKSDDPASNYGNDTVIALDSEPPEAGLLYWDVTSIPVGSSVASVDITINVGNTSSGDFEIFDVKRPWVEDEATWNEYASGQSWEIAGADGSLDRGATPLGAVVGSETGPVTISLNAAGIAVVQNWIDDPSSNHGLISRDYVNHSNGLGLSSREVPTSAQRPELTITLAGNEQPGLSIDDVTVLEGVGGTVDAVFTVTLTEAYTQAVTVDYTTADSTALSGSDYTATSGTLTIPVDYTSGMITVPITDDVISESSEVFKLLLSNPVGATLSDSLGLGTITDNEAVPILSIADANTNEDAGTIDFTVTMSGISAQAVTVDYATADSSAMDGSDYTAISGTLTIPVDSTSGVITVPITDDAITEGSEVFKLLLSNASGASLSDSLGFGTIIDNEAAPTLSISDASADEAAATIDFTVTMSGISAQTVTIDYATADSSALAGSDYTATSGTLTIPMDSTSGMITVPITDDLVSEGSEVFKLLLSDALGASLTDSLGLGTITDNEAAPTLSINDVNANEDTGTIDFIVTMSGISGQTVTVDYATADSSALAGSDYANTTGTLTIPVDSTSGVIAVPITDDVISEGDEVFKLLLTDPTNATLLDSLGLGTILDNEAAPVLSIVDASTNENAGTIDFTVTISGASAQTVTVDFATADSSALAGSDYAATSGTLTIPVDSTSGVITVPITDDLVSEGEEVFKMLLSNATGATISDSLALGTIIDNEAAPTLSINDINANEDAGTIDFTVTMSGASAQAVTVDYATADSSAIAGSDYTTSTGTLTIPMDSTSGVITVPVTDDLISEGSEVFKMLLSNATGATMSDSLGLGTIIDNEAAPTLSINDINANEDAGTMAFTVTMSGISAQTVTVDYATADSSALTASDYTATSGTLTIPMDSTTGVITVPITDDVISEGSEVFKMLLSNATGAALLDSLALGTIIDNEAAPTLSVADASANEDAGTIDFTVTMSGISAQAVTVDYATADSSALAESDYANTTGTLSIPMDSTSGVITVPITNDLVSEGSEVFKMLLSNAAGAALLDSLALGTIIDNEAAPTLSINDLNANEDAGTMAFTVTMSGVSAQTVTVDYATADSSALAGSDYANTTGTLTIPMDSTSGVITVPITDDLLSEGSEVFKLLLSSASGASLTDSLGLGTIIDNEAAPTLSINDINANEDAGTMAFTVTMSGISAQAVTLDFATADSSALAGSDYTATSGTLTIPMDSTTGVITVPIADDVISEGSEVFRMLLSNATGATMSDSLGLGTILDNEAAPTLSVADASANEDVGTINFSVTMSGASAQTVTVDYATADSSAIAGSDYANTTGTLTIPMDSTSGVITVPITDDLLSEGSEVFKLLLSDASGASLTDSLGLGTVLDNEAAPTLSINDINANEEAGTMAFTVTMSGISAQAVTVDYATSDSTALAGSDYTATSGTLTIPMDSTSGVITVPITDDVISEGSEVFKMLLSSATGATMSDSLALGTIIDNEVAPTLTIADASANEDAGTINFTVTMSGISAQTVTVDYATADSSAIAGSDYTTSTGTLTIPMDSTSGVITVPITDNLISEGSEVFKVLLSNASGATLLDSLGLGTIMDNEAAPTLSIADASTNEDAGTMAFTVTMSGISAQTVTVDFATADSSAIAGSDYTNTTGTLTIPVDSTSGVITVPITDDAVSEGSEVFKMLLSGASGASLTDSLGLGTIIDNEAAPTLSINDVNANEDAGTMAFTVTMSGISAQTITVDYATADSSATRRDSDYANTTGTLTIPIDSTSGVITVPITDDLVSEGTEVFKMLLSGASGATLLDSLALGTILDNDAAPVLSIADASANEDAGTIDFTVTMSGISAQAVTVDYATADSSALAGSDYTAATSGTLTIPVDSTSGVITVPITDDAISEGAEVFKLQFSSAAGATMSDSLGLGTILDNEAAPTLSIADASANENAGTINFIVTMSGISAQAVTVDYVTADSSALAGTDYAAYDRAR